MAYKSGKEISLHMPSDLYDKLEELKNGSEYKDLSRSAFINMMLRRSLQMQEEAEKVNGTGTKSA